MLTKVAYTDWRTKKIPNRLVLLFMIFCLGAIEVFPEIRMMQRITGFFVISVPLLWLACVVPGSIGGGDIKLMAAGGFLLGVSDICDAFALGILAAGAYVISLLILKRIHRKTEIALGPFLCLGIISIVLKI